MIRANLHVLASEKGTEGARSTPASMGARHKFTPYANPERNKDCARCGKPERDSVHAYVDLAHRAAVVAHLAFASNAAQRGDLKEAAREARIATRLAEEE